MKVGRAQEKKRDKVVKEPGKRDEYHIHLLRAEEKKLCTTKTSMHKVPDDRNEPGIGIKNKKGGNGNSERQEDAIPLVGKEKIADCFIEKDDAFRLRPIKHLSGWGEDGGSLGGEASLSDFFQDEDDSFQPRAIREMHVLKSPSFANMTNRFESITFLGDTIGLS